MRRLGILGLLVGLLALAVVAGATAAPSHKLRSFEARGAAESAAYNFERRNKLETSTVGRCIRQAKRRMLCLATATADSARKVKTCEMRIKVRAVYPGYWTERANVVWRRCRSEVKPLLSYPAALAAFQGTADAFAGAPTLITYMYRRDDVNFAATARWQRSRVPPSEFLPTEDCSVDMVATLSAGAVTVVADGFLCY